MTRHECPTVAPMRCAAHVQLRGEIVCHPDVCVPCLKNAVHALEEENRELRAALEIAVTCANLLGAT